MRLVKNRKLSPFYVVPYEIFKRFRRVAYELRFLNELDMIHLVFHVSMLEKCEGDPFLL